MGACAEAVWEVVLPPGQALLGELQTLALTLKVQGQEGSTATGELGSSRGVVDALR